MPATQPNHLKIWQFTDTHLFARRDEAQPHYSAEILDACLDAFIKEPDCNILLISGDLTCNGHADEHRALIPKLRRVGEAGKRLFVITATHDYGLDFIQPCPDDGSAPLDRPEGKMYQSDLRGLYNEFGFAEAIAEFQRNSYVVQLAPGVRLLALNDDGDGHAFCGFYEDQMQWAMEQIQQARRDNQLLFGMTHHPTIPPSPIYPLISSRDMLGNYEETTTRLADAGLRLMLTGHTHMHSVQTKTTAAGNAYTDVNTCALSMYPGLFRELILDGRKMSITTKHIPNFALAGGQPVQDLLEQDFDFLLRDIIESADHDFDHFSHAIGGMSVTPEQAYKLKLPLHLAGTVINRITLGGLGRLLCCKIPKAVRKLSFKELFLELVRNIYGGTEHYSPDTDEYKALLAIIRRAEPFVGKKLPEAMQPLPEFFASLIYDPVPDWEAEIAL